MLDELNRRGVNWLAFKGLALATAVYPSSALRRIGDADLLVAPGHEELASEVLTGHGFARSDDRAESARALLHGSAWMRGDIAIDLHRYALYGHCAHDADAGFWQRAIPWELDGLGGRTLSPADHLILLCAHGWRWSPVPPVHWAADAAMLLRAGSAINWVVVIAESQRRGLVPTVAGALRLLRDELAAPIPTAALRTLESLPVPGWQLKERRSRSRPPAPGRGLFLHWCDFQRARGPRSLLARLLGFPGYLRDLWGLGSLALVPMAALRKGIGRFRTDRVEGPPRMS